MTRYEIDTRQRPGRCGSYPLMNIAQDFGVDYGDVLLVAQHMREGQHGAVIPAGRAQEAAQAGLRLQTTIGSLNYARLVGRLVERLPAGGGL